MNATVDTLATVTTDTEDYGLTPEVLEAVKELPIKAEEGFEALIYSLVPGDAEILRTVTTEWDFENPPQDINELALNMVASLQYHGGVGLSANQVGLPYRIFAMKAATPFVCINPVLVWWGEEEVELEEGCLTFPGIVAKINRPKHIRVRFNVPSGLAVTKTFTGLTARVVQHEIAHLDGGFFFDGIGRLRMEKALKGSEKLGHNYRHMNLMKRAVE